MPRRNLRQDIIRTEDRQPLTGQTLEKDNLRQDNPLIKQQTRLNQNNSELDIKDKPFTGQNLNKTNLKEDKRYLLTQKNHEQDYRTILKESNRMTHPTIDLGMINKNGTNFSQDKPYTRIFKL